MGPVLSGESLSCPGIADRPLHENIHAGARGHLGYLLRGVEHLFEDCALRLHRGEREPFHADRDFHVHVLQGSRCR